MTIEKLSIQEILNSLPKQSFEVIVEQCITSTNDYLLDLISKRENDLSKIVVLAETQTNGKGRQGRTWISPPGNILMSVYWPFKCNLESLYGLSLVVGIAVARALQASGLSNVQLKWPNDIYWQGHKMGGILIETKQNKSGIIDTVIGLGLNLVDLAEHRHEIDQKAVALENALGCKVSRNKLVADLLNEMNLVLTQFAHEGFGDFVAEWKALDAKITSGTPGKLDALAKIMYADGLKTIDFSQKMKIEPLKR
jgi:BirA family biotin operon repressor/biotin-[acetyl-CoA-carboxylase] ligase